MDRKTESDEILRAVDLSVSYGSRAVLRGVNFSLRRGEIVVAAGANGCGKTTLLRAAAGLLRPSGGGFVFDGQPLTDYSRPALARKLAILAQTADRLPDVTVRAYVSYGRYPFCGSFLREADERAVDEALDLTGLAELSDRRVGELSGGELQRVRLAMAAAQSPSLLLLDEPSSFLDLAGQSRLAAFMKRLQAERGTTILAVLHDLNLASRCADRLIFLKDGSVAASGKPSELLKPELLTSVYGADLSVLHADGREIVVI